MVMDTLSYQQAIEQGLLQTSDKSIISDDARFVVTEDDGSHYGPIII